MQNVLIGKGKCNKSYKLINLNCRRHTLVVSFRVQKHVHVKKLPISQVWSNRFCSTTRNMAKFFISTNNAVRKNIERLRYRQKYEFSLFGYQILTSTKKQSELLVNMPGLLHTVPHLLKRWNWALQPELDEHTFLISTKKDSKYTPYSVYMLFSVSPFTVSSNARLNPNLKMTLDNPHNASLTLK